ncbi:tyrosine-type recombinase/integrase [Alienimonas californiensis]|uniref:Site-specific tyrosine recombinase XerD n=1 Tax=Alienimonas californiensis TaxID=2527989 RepID=A0A517PB47_9PLAN|nr:site-specific integrase [Alienimonas californiensis]QDT16605.1 site-specific tyrosine recombinase XerD [Alienimonas californiensis]
MPRRPSKPPSYRLHKPSGQARVILAGKHHYLGAFGAPESKEAYARLIAERFLAPGPAADCSNAPDTPDSGVATGAASGVSGGVSQSPVPRRRSVNDLMVAYLDHAEGYYARDGEPTQELTDVKASLKPLRLLYGRTPADEFGPKKLKAVRDHMVAVQGLSRKVTNARVNRIRRFFKWCASEELVPSSVFHGLQSVDGLRMGRTAARETAPVKPVPDADVEATLPFLSPPVAAMVKVQRLTGMRPGEVVQMKPGDVDRNGEVWVYRPECHKNEWRGQERTVPLGPKAQAVFAPFLDGRPDDKPLFSPKEAEQWRYAESPPYAGRERATERYPSETRRLAAAKAARRKQKRKPERKARDHYDRDSYRRAVTYGIEKAARAGVAIDSWSPARLRHAKATEVRAAAGLEAAQAALGHKRADVTQIYAERNLSAAVELAKASG